MDLRAMGIPAEDIRVDVDGEMDLRGTLGISKDVPVGFEAIHARFELRAPKATPEQLATLKEKTEQYCVVMQTLMKPPPIRTSWIYPVTANIPNSHEARFTPAVI